MPCPAPLRALSLVVLLAGCGAAETALAPDAPDIAGRRAVDTITLPPMKTFGQARPAVPARDNATLARDFLDLSFRMESGRALPVLTRFEQPVTVRMIGAVPPAAATDLAGLLERLRSEAGIDIRRVSAAEPAAITVEFITRAALQRNVPQAACFVVPNVRGWREFRGARRSPTLDWTRLDRRRAAAVFIPADTSPQEVRDCLHEELAQALGPLNDLYRLSDSIFNDDNFHTVLTGFDMLMLRTTYDPALRNGMTEAEVAAALPDVLARLNPGGGHAQPAAGRAPSHAWMGAIEDALSPRGSRRQRRDAAERALTMAQQAGWQDARTAFSWFAMGRLALARESGLAFESFRNAAALYATLPDARIHIAHIDMQMAALALSAGQPDDALQLVNGALIPVERAQNAGLLASLLMLKAEALDLLDRPSEARAVRLDSLGWARYGFGDPDEVRDRMAEIAQLSPRARLAEAR